MMASEKRGCHVMLSYCWSDNQELIKKIKTALNKRGFQTWMDLDQMSGNINKAMAEGVEGAYAVLMCVGQKYMKSRNCEKEAGYADSKQKPIITVIVERGLVLEGWAGVINGSRLYYDFSDQSNFDSKLNELVKALEPIKRATEYKPSDVDIKPRSQSRRKSEKERLAQLAAAQLGEFDLQG
ncbi:uncharacterized protein [Ptychodera flava]|uniref:uncharacterized protein n=1 Tax=Ptychodera flava TaxID=63121 RepID=UPI003969E299